MWITFLPLTDWVQLPHFLARVDCSGECWVYTGGHGNGYGRHWRLGGGTVQAHRFAYASLVGSIPDGLHRDHLCRNRACVCPDHLEPVTPRENTLRGIGPSAINAARTVCAHGHPCDDATTGRRPNGRRFCRECGRGRQRAYRARRRQCVLGAAPVPASTALPPTPVADNLAHSAHHRDTAPPGQLIHTTGTPTRHDGAKAIVETGIATAHGAESAASRIPVTVSHTTRKNGKKRTVSSSRTFTAAAPRDLDVLARHLHALRRARPTIAELAGEVFDRAGISPDARVARDATAPTPTALPPAPDARGKGHDRRRRVSGSTSRAS